MQAKWIVSISSAALLIAAAWTIHEASAQDERRVDVSPRSVISQRIGLQEVTIVYHRPGVNDPNSASDSFGEPREIWGALVPYGRVWRAGANENTTIKFESAVTIEGKDLDAGTYGFFIIPSESEWTLAFSKNSTSWGNFAYNEGEDALRVTITPQDAPSEARLRYGFEDLTATSVTAYLTWAGRKGAFKITLQD